METGETTEERTSPYHKPFMHNSKKPISVLILNESKWPSHVVLVISLQQLIKLQTTNSRPLYLAPHWVGTKVKESKKQMMHQKLSVGVMDLAQAKWYHLLRLNVAKYPHFRFCAECLKLTAVTIFICTTLKAWRGKLTCWGNYDFFNFRCR